VQVGVDARTGRPEVVTFAQHGWAEGCAWEQVERAGGAPVVHVAAASHASYPRAGTHGRPWPDPDDEADGRGRSVRPQVRPFGAWARYPGRWGGARARWFAPGESDSPRGPAFQPEGPHADPAGFHARARPCGSGAPPHPPAVIAGAGALAAAVLGGLLARAVRSRRRGPFR
jgi:hypothetical protein